MMRRWLGSIVVLCAAAANADDSDAVKYRQHTMTAVGGHMKAAVSLVKGEVDHKGDLAVHAAGLAALSRIAPGLFGADAKGGDALPKIWDEPDAFKERLDAFRSAAEAFDAAVKGGDAAMVGSALGKLGQACKGCHDKFRKE
jgi:cytochrome c556